MDLGLGNLKTLKNFLLPVGQRDSADYDELIGWIGQGVAQSFERFCNRSFARVEGDTYEVSADRGHLVVARYPIEVVTAIDLKASYGDEWAAQVLADVVVDVSNASGLVRFAGELGSDEARVRVTYTGGFWYDTTEDSSGAQPVGSMALPPALRLNWLLQCQHVWAQMDKLGLAIAEKPKAGSSMLEIKLLPQVEADLAGYRRFGV